MQPKTIDEVIRRRNISGDDVDTNIMNRNVDFKEDKTYSFCGEYRMSTWTYSDIGRFSIIGYYPMICEGLYLLKRRLDKDQAAAAIRKALYGD